MSSSLINGFIRPDGSLLEGNHHDTLARNEFKNITNFEIDPSMPPSMNLVKAGYLLVSIDAIFLPSNPSQIQIDTLISMLRLCDINKVPEFDSMNSKSLKYLADSIINANTETLKFLKLYLNNLYQSKNEQSR